MSILSLKNVSLTYFSDIGETHTLNNITFDIEKSEFISIVGPSGCGKTSILNIVSGLVSATSGEVMVDGFAPNIKNDFIGYMFQKDLLFEWRTVLKNVYLGLEIQNKKTKENVEYANSLLKKYDLWDFRNNFPSQLSGGMRQRVALIRTLALQPKIMLLDEAFSALDYQTRIKICDDVHRILKNEGITSILVTHDLAESISVSDRIIVLSSRPATVKSIHKVDFNSNLTPLQRRESGEFKGIFKQIWEELQNEEV